MNSIVEITVKNWKEMNPDSIQMRCPSWFRLEVGIVSSSSLFNLSPQQKWVWICILSLCCKKKNGTISVNLNHLSVLANVKKNDVIQTIEILDKDGALSVNSELTRSKLPPQTNRQTDKQTNSISDFDFEKVYEGYPRKEGKSDGLKKCHIDIKTQDQYNDLEKAVAKYSKICKEERREKKFIKQFSSFMSTWRDYISKLEDKKEPPKPDNWHTPEQLTRPSATGPSVDVRELRRLADVTEIFRRNSKIE